MAHRKYRVLPDDAPPIFTTAQLAEMMGLSVITLRSYRNRGKGPRYFRAPDSNRMIYAATDVDEWLASTYEEQVSA